MILQKRFFSQWLHSRLAASTKTVALLIDKTEVSQIACLSHLNTNSAFINDLALHKALWVNLEKGERCLIVQQEAGDDKNMIELGKLTQQQLVSKRIADVEVIASSRVNVDSLPLFYKSFWLSNFEYSEKTYMDVEVKESADDRIHRHSKVVDSVILSHEQDIQTNKMLYMMAVRESLNFTRQLSNMRATVCNPDYMETVIRAVADGLDVHVIKGPELQKQGLNCHYEVGKGATAPPRYISVSYYGNPTSGEVDLALVGKCLTYDTGGLNIKKSTMEEMHLDKTGACAVLGTLHATMTLKPKKNVVFVFGIAENAIGASVYKPGDIIKSLKGLTVEVGNTDAEGRLVLADCITYTCRKFNPRRMIDIASLTGSIMVALGESTGGLFSNNDLFAKSLEEAGKEHGEPLWRMPIMEEHRETIKRDAADLNNCGKIRYADASNAAAFLERFLEKREDGTDVEWAHLDIAGVCISKEMGCTGFGLQTMLDAVHK